MNLQGYSNTETLVIVVVSLDLDEALKKNHVIRTAIKKGVKRRNIYSRDDS